MPLNAPVIRRMILTLATAFSTIGCGPDKPANPKKAVVEFKGLQLRVGLESGSPLAEALRNGLNEFEARTGSTISLEEKPVGDANADLLVIRGDRLSHYPDLLPLGRQFLESAAMDYSAFPSAYRNCFDRRDEQNIAIPIGVDATLLWFRADLIGDKAIPGDAPERTKTISQVPATWEELVAAAESLRNAKRTEWGCAFACDGSSEAVRNFLVMAAASAKGPRWSSFAIDTENGSPRLLEPPFEKALNNWLKLLTLSPAANGKMVSDADARRAFVEGKAAFLLTNVAPTVGIKVEGKPSAVIQLDCAALPGSRQVFEPRSKTSATSKDINRCFHYGTGGWLIAIGKTENRPAAERLLQFLTSSEEGVYLVQAAKRGFVPVRPKLLNEPARFLSYGLTSAAVNRYFVMLQDGMQGENWVADIRSPLAPELEKSLWKALENCRTGKMSATDALKAADRDWRSTIELKRVDFLKQYRDSLGLPMTQ